MLAIPVEDTSALARLDAAAPASERPVRSVSVAPKGFEGEDFPARRAFAGVDLAHLDPFIHLDQRTEASEVLLLGGQPIREPVACTVLAW